MMTLPFLVKNDDDHDAYLIALMERAKTNRTDIQQQEMLHTTRISPHFFGVVFGKDGMSPDPKKIQGIMEMPPPRGHHTTTVFPRNGQFLCTILFPIYHNTQQH